MKEDKNMKVCYFINILIERIKFSIWSYWISFIEKISNETRLSGGFNR